MRARSCCGVWCVVCWVCEWVRVCVWRGGGVCARARVCVCARVRSCVSVCKTKSNIISTHMSFFVWSALNVGNTRNSFFHTSSWFFAPTKTIIITIPHIFFPSLIQKLRKRKQITFVRKTCPLWPWPSSQPRGNATMVTTVFRMPSKAKRSRGLVLWLDKGDFPENLHTVCPCQNK